MKHFIDSMKEQAAKKARSLLLKKMENPDLTLTQAKNYWKGISDAYGFKDELADIHIEGMRFINKEFISRQS